MIRVKKVEKKRLKCVILTVFTLLTFFLQAIRTESGAARGQDNERNFVAGWSDPSISWPRASGQKWGSIKGDVKKKHPSLRRKGSKFLTSRSRPVAATRSRVSLRTFLFMLLVAPAGTLAPTSSVVAFGQPWFYLRLEAYRFIGLSEEAYGRSGDSKPEPHLGYSSSNPWRSRGDGPQDTSDYVPMTRCAQAACVFTCSALNVSPSFQIFSVMAAILRASVSRAISGRMPLANSPE